MTGRSLIIRCILLMTLAMTVTAGFFVDRKKRMEEAYDALTMDFVKDHTVEYGHIFSPKQEILSYDGDLTISGKVDTKKVGNYELTYRLEGVEERYGQEISRTYTRIIPVEDHDPPHIEVDKQIVRAYTDGTYDLSDNVLRVYDDIDGEIPEENITLSINGDVNKPGNYTVTIKAIDSNGLISLADYELVMRRPHRLGQNASYIYSVLTEEFGFNHAAACGILANIKFESTFNPTDEYQGFYGLCQWGYGRLTNLFSWCEANGYDPNSVDGQLHFMWMELNSSYGSVRRALMAIEDTPEGAYEAAYIFSARYEAPATNAGRAELGQSYWYIF